ncbi:MAG: hypothetical protein AAGN15_06690 [Cyanobacteria bacterium J06581_3]
MMRLLQRLLRKVGRWLGLSARRFSKGEASPSHKTQPAQAEVPSVEMRPLSDRAYETLYFSLLKRQENSAPNVATAQIKERLKM